MKTPEEVAAELIDWYDTHGQRSQEADVAHVVAIIRADREEVRREQMEADCRAVCCWCRSHPESLNVGMPREEWWLDWHRVSAGEYHCAASAIRQSFKEGN